MRYSILNQIYVGVGGLLLSTSIASADAPLFTPPHGLLVIEIDENQQLFTDSATGEFDSSMLTVNAAGQTILKHNKGGVKFESSGVTIYPGGIAERDGNSPLDPATATSTKLLADDPGFFAEGGIFPAADYVLTANYFDSLRYFAPGGTEWTDPLNGEQLRIFDLTNNDETGGAGADLEFMINGVQPSDIAGSINIDKTGTAVPPINVTGVHGHVGYELSQPDGNIPAQGAYMIFATLSANQTPDAGGSVLKDSEPIFIVFNNQLSNQDYGLATAAAEALPEPTTGMILVATGIGMLGVRRYRRVLGHGSASRSGSSPWIIARPKLGRDVPREVSFRV